MHCFEIKPIIMKTSVILHTAGIFLYLFIGSNIGFCQINQSANTLDKTFIAGAGTKETVWQDFRFYYEVQSPVLLSMEVTHDELDILFAHVWLNDDFVGEMPADEGAFIFLFEFENMTEGDLYSFQFALSDDSFSDTCWIHYDVVYTMLSGYAPPLEEVIIEFEAIAHDKVEMTAWHPVWEITSVMEFINGIVNGVLFAYDGKFSYVFDMNELNEYIWFDFRFQYGMAMTAELYHVPYATLAEAIANYDPGPAKHTYLYTTGTKEAVTLIWDAIPLDERSDIAGFNVFKQTLPGDEWVQLNAEMIVSADAHYSFRDETASDPDNPPTYEIQLIASDAETYTFADIAADNLLNFKPVGPHTLHMYLRLWQTDSSRDLSYLMVFVDGIFHGNYDYDDDNPLILPMDTYYEGICYDFIPVYSEGYGAEFEVCDGFIQYMLGFYQPFPADGANWHYDFSNGADEGYVNISHIGDTTLQGKYTSIVQKDRHRYSHLQDEYYYDNLGTDFFHFDGDRVYVYRHEQFYVLWDFTAVPGDSWLIPGSFDAGCDTTAMVTVVASGDTLIQGQKLRYIELQTDDEVQNHWAYHGIIVERIGPLHDYLFPSPTSHCVVDMFEGGALRCYQDDDYPLFETGLAPACDFMVGLNEMPDETTFMLAPNPASKRVNIRFHLQEESHVSAQLFDLNGSLLLNLLDERLPGGKHMLPVNTSYLKPGMYLLSLKTRHSIHTRKLVIH